MALRGPCVRKLLTGLIMYIYPLKIKNIVLYCIVLYCIAYSNPSTLLESGVLHKDFGAGLQTDVTRV